MKFKYTLILLGAVLFTLTACSSSKEDDPKEDPFVKTMWESSSYIGNIQMANNTTSRPGYTSKRISISHSG